MASIPPARWRRHPGGKKIANDGKKSTISACFFALWAFPAIARAADAPLNEFDSALVYIRAQAGYNVVGGFGDGYRGVGYGRVVTSWLELSLRARYVASVNTDQTPGETTFEATAGPTFNFSFSKDSRGLGDDFFVSLGAGVNYTAINSLTVPGTFYATDQVYAANPAFSVEIGKRFALFPNVSLKPSLSVGLMIGSDVVNGTSAATPSISVNPVELSIIF